MHLGTVLLLLELVLVLVVEVALVFATAMTLQAGGEAAGEGTAAKTMDNVVVQERVKDVEDLKGANEIIEKLSRTLREQTIRRGDNHIRQHASPIGTVDSTGGGPSAVHFNGATPTEKKTSRTKHLKAPNPPPPFPSPSSADANGHRPNVHAPKYMLDLYDKFSTDKYSHPMANIVRSFMNINEEALDAPPAAAAENAAAAGGIASNASSSSSHRVHRLLFNVTSIGRDEEIYLAELRLFTLVETDRQLYEGINRRVTVSEVIGATTSTSSSSSRDAAVDGGDGSVRLELIDSKEIYGRHSGWEKITITEAVRRWVKQRPQGDIHMLEVRIWTVGRLLKDESTSSRSSSSSSRNASIPAPLMPVFDINWRPNNENEPLLLVFSNDRRHQKVFEESNELNEIPDDDDDDDDDDDEADDRPDVHPNEPEVDYAYYDDELAYEYEDDVAVVERRKKREAAAATDRGIRMRMGRGSASRARRGTEESEEWGDVDSLSPADQIDYPVEMVAKRMPVTSRNKTRSMEGEEEDDDEDEEAEVDDNNFRWNGGRHRLVGRKRVRRGSGKRRLRRNSCHRIPMHVNFEDINWHNWILRPSGYQAYECTGRCNFPLDDRLTPTKHAIIQTMLNANYPKKAAETCCVPTKLEPISILYVDDQGIVTYKYKYDGMVVVECGCR